MSRFSFQIEPGAEFPCAQVQSPLRALQSRIAKVRTADRIFLSASRPMTRTSFEPRNDAVKIPSRKPAIEFRPIPAQPLPAVAAPAPADETNLVKYKGHVISAVQIENGNWIATHRRMGSEAAPRKASPAQKKNSYMARFLAVAGAELEIDEIEHRKLRAKRTSFQIVKRHAR